eukprot:682925-Alexandrium_andersonii.AAC.1
MCASKIPDSNVSKDMVVPTYELCAPRGARPEQLHACGALGSKLPPADNSRDHWTKGTTTPQTARSVAQNT